MANSISWLLSKLRFPLPVELGGTGSAGQTSARANLGAAKSGINTDITSLSGLADMRVTGSSLVIAGNQGSYALWNTGISGTSGSADYVCNQGAGSGGFTWRTVNNANSLGGPAMVYRYDGTLLIPLGPAPINDGGANCGRPELRWATVYAVNGTIQTSDAREKTPINPMSDNEIKAGIALAKEIGTYKWLHSITEKGESDARSHIGMTVQRAIEIMGSFGLEPLKYAFICYDEWDAEAEVLKEHVLGNAFDKGTLIYEGVEAHMVQPDMLNAGWKWEETSREMVVTKPFRPAGNRYGFRYDQLALFIARGQEERIKRLEAAINL